MNPKVGVPRIYDGDILPVLYPGEQAHAQIKLAEGHVAVSWLVEPMPGWHGRQLRVRYRLYGRWLSKLGFGKPKIETKVTLKRTEERA